MAENGKMSLHKQLPKETAMPQFHCNTKQRHFKHLCLFQRSQIQALPDSGLPKTQIAKRIGNVAAEAIQRIEDWSNELPRKTFDYRTPRELFEEQLAMLQFPI